MAKVCCNFQATLTIRSFNLSIEQQRMVLEGVPLLLMFCGDINIAKAKGSILFFHGLGASKDIQIKELESLAQRGFLAIGIDNVGHGDRRYENFDELFSQQNPNLEKDFTDAVYSTAKELPKVIDGLLAKDLIVLDKIGVTGISMGGYVTYRAILEDKRVKAAVSILGSPRWKIEHPDSPHLHLDKFYPIALLSQNAGKDESVPPHNAREFHQQLISHYAVAPERIAYEEYPESGHFMHEDDWNCLWEKTLKWFERFL